jgi:hypothetical protein
MVENKTSKQRIVYLFGAGATQAAVTRVDDACKILISDVSQAVLYRIRSEKKEDLYSVSNELLDVNMDVEHLITLLESSHYPRHSRMANELRQLFRSEVRKRLGKFSKKLSPNLYTALFDLYEIDGFNEELAGVISLNYDQIAELGFAQIYGGVDYVVDVVCQHSVIQQRKSIPPFIKLHGSFNWKHHYPIALVDEDDVDDDHVLWIPPGLGKRADHYPFDLLWGRAYEILNCDILRVIGCSLSPNDMHLVSLIFRTQKLSRADRGYTIELIDYPEKCKEIADRYRYLSIREIMDQPDFVYAIASELFPSVQAYAEITEVHRREIANYLEPRKVNVFDRWLRMKAENLLLDGYELSTTVGAISEYVDGA